MMVINFCIPFDSIPAILAIITDSSIVIISNIFAILGLRSLYFYLLVCIVLFVKVMFIHFLADLVEYILLIFYFVVNPIKKYPTCYEWAIHLRKENN